MRAERGIVFALLVVLALLTPMAYLSPPDPTWIHGFWDNADGDDIILQIQSAAGALESLAPHQLGPIFVLVGFTLLLLETGVVSGCVSSNQTRAPPVR